MAAPADGSLSPVMIRVILIPHLDHSGRREHTVCAGTSVAAIVALVAPVAPLDNVRVVLVGPAGDHVITPDMWRAVRPKSGAVLVVRVAPGDSGALRSALTIGASIAAMTIGGPLFAGLGAFAPVATAALGMGLTLLVNSLVPVETPAKASGKTPHTITGFQNQLSKDGVVPAVLGKVRWAPVYAAAPWTKADSHKRFITAAFLCGYGPLRLSDIRIGDTPIEKFKGVEIEVLEGFPTDGKMSIYNKQVVEKQLSINLTWVDGEEMGPESEFTAIDGTEFSFDVSFPQGLYAMTKEKSPRQIQMGVGIEIGWRPAESTSEADWVIKTYSYWAKSMQPVVFTTRITPRDKNGARLPRGQYEVRWKRLTEDWDEVNDIGPFQACSRCDITALRTFRPEYPINFGLPLALINVRIKGTGRLNGMLDTLNVLCSSILPDWDRATGTWIARETNNPASIFRHILTGPQNAYPVPTSAMRALEEWHEWCAAKGLEYNAVITDEGSVLDRLKEVAAAGRASPQDLGAEWTVVIDRILDTVAGHVTPRNSWGFEWTRNYSRLPDAFRVKFLDQANSHEAAERIVPLPHFTGGEPQIVQDLELQGYTDAAKVWREARRRGYELLHRPDTYTAFQDWEHLAVTRGDLVMVSHDVLDRVQQQGRVVETLTVGDSVIVRLDEPCAMEAGTAYVARFRLADGSTLLRTVATVPGETDILRLTGTGGVPQPGDLFIFGVAGREALECIVKGVEMQEDLSAKLYLIDHAPQIETLADAEVAPPWSGRGGRGDGREHRRVLPRPDPLGGVGRQWGDRGRRDRRRRRGGDAAAGPRRRRGRHL